ncbi:MAG TPA: TRAP transporter substrate-binding protein DctP [Gammaproteobacteria bacterium]|jgi:TRAP-type mannitol/chloroaromatic compound transport system substrate-binding protein
MKRREFITGLGSGAALAACTPGQQQSTASTESFNWRMVTTWLPNFPGLGTGVNTLARYLEELSGGRMRITIYGAGELIPAFEVFDAVSQGSAEMGHGAAYYWRGKSEATQFFACIPFGMNAHEMNAWLYYGGGLELWREVYGRFNLMPFPAGNTGVQMGGWFKRQINSLADLRGLKMRIPGIGGEVLRRAGGTPVNLPLSEIFTALQTGSIDATEWVGPYNDLALGLHNAAQYYYYPGWQEPGPTLECMVNLDAWNSLPEDLQAMVRIACQATTLDMISEFMARNANSLEQIRASGTDVRAFPEDVLAGLKRLTYEVVEELAARDPLVARVWTSYRDFMQHARGWQLVSEQAILNTTSL